MPNRSLDSFTLLIEVEKCTFINDKLLSKVLEVVEDTGEIVKEHDRKSSVSDVNGISTSVGFSCLFGKNYIKILCTSKMLQQHYLKGISISTTRYLHSYIMSLGLITFSHTDLLTSKIYDVDIKSDFKLSDYEFIEWIRQKRRSVKGSKKFESKKDGNYGIQYGNRNNSTPSYPFVKFYSKGLELYTRSSEFKNNFLSYFSDLDLRRVEVTVRNMKHVDYLLKNKIIKNRLETLSDWLSLTSFDLKNIITYCIWLHEREYDFAKVRQKKATKISATDFLILSMYDMLLQDGHLQGDILKAFDKFPSSPNSKAGAKARIKKKFTRFDEIMNNTDDVLRRLNTYSFI